MLKVYNVLNHKKEDFTPIDGKKVGMYACGITVYDLSHIGHARQAIVYAMIADYLRFRGYNVKYVRNYTDVDDKIIKRANELGKDAFSYYAQKEKKFIIEDGTFIIEVGASSRDIRDRKTITLGSL